jgi:type I restriction enzyme, S subunit
VRWPQVQLRHVARFAYGESLAAEDRRDGDIRVFGSNGAVGLHDRPNTLGPVLVVGRKGSYGKIQFSSEPVFAIDTTYYVDGSTTAHDIRWLYYSLSTLGLDLLSQDVGVPGLSREAAYVQRIDLPSRAEQRAIADYLDAETARIDALITKKQRMIELAEQRWAALVQTYLTTDCTLVPLRRLLSRLPEYGAGESGIEPVEGWPRYIRITDIDVEGGLRAEGALSLSPEVARPYLLEDGDLLLARSGATVGRSLLFDHSMGEAAYAGYLIRFRFDDRRLRPALAFYWTLTDHYWSQVRMAALQATIENVSAEKFKDFMVPVPPLESQGRLEGRLALGRLQLQRLLTSTTRQIDLLREHRQVLITAAVTGEIEVPGVAA